MNEIEHHLEKWRGAMRMAGIRSPMVLDELEGHLREEIERRLSAGASAAEAYEVAVRLMGDPSMLKEEFDKEAVSMRHTRIHAVLLAALAVQLGVFAMMFQWLSGISATAGPVGLPRTPEWMLPWHAVLGFGYAAAILATLVMRRWQPSVGRSMMRWLNWALLPVAPFGTLLGLYGIWIARRDRSLEAVLTAAR